MTYGLRNPRCTQCFQEVRVPVDQSCPFERIEELIEELEKLMSVAVRPLARFVLSQVRARARCRRRGNP